MPDKQDKRTNSSTKRLFIAIPLPSSIKEYLYEEISYLSKADKEIRTIPTASIHITLKFLGNTEDSRLEKILRAIDLTAGKFSKFYYSLGRIIDAFPSLKAARVIFVPVISGENQIKEIFSELKEGENLLLYSSVNKKGRKEVLQKLSKLFYLDV